MTTIPGVGLWTVQGFFITALNRSDVVLPSDMALRKAIRKNYKLNHLPSQDEVLEISQRWRPYRSLATAYLFQSAFGGHQNDALARCPREFSSATAAMHESGTGPFRAWSDVRLESVMRAPKRTPPTTTDLWVHDLGYRHRTYGVICPDGQITGSVSSPLRKNILFGGLLEAVLLIPAVPPR